MAYEIKIYGDVVHVSDAAPNKVSLLDLQNQLSEANGEPLFVRLNGNGGDVDEGFAMYYELRRYAKNNKVPVHTFAESRLNSIYTVIFLAGDERELSSDLQPFVHKAHYPDAKSITQAQKIELDKANTRIAQHYSDHTELTFDEAMQLMEQDTFIPTKMAKKMRFATKIEKVLRPAAFKRFDDTININNDKMSDNKKSLFKKGLEALLKAAGIQNKMVDTADMKKVDFYELLEDEPIEVGANATIDGAPAEGEVVMANGETYVFAAGVLTEIRPAGEDPANDDATEIEALKQEVADLKASNESLKAKVDETAITNKTLLKTISNIRKLESEIVDTPPAARPTNTASKAPVKGSRFAKAIDNFKSQNKQ